MVPNICFISFKFKITMHVKSVPNSSEPEREFLPLTHFICEQDNYKFIYLILQNFKITMHVKSVPNSSEPEKEFLHIINVIHFY
jgi:hypothetical protein